MESNSRLYFDQFGWWNSATIAKLEGLAVQNTPGWFAVSDPHEQHPYFVSGATTERDAIAAGMPWSAAKNGEIKTPLQLLDR